MSNKKESKHVTKPRIKRKKKRSQIELIVVFLEILSQDVFLKDVLFRKAGTNYTTGNKILNFLKEWGLAENV